MNSTGETMPHSLCRHLTSASAPTIELFFNETLGCRNTLNSLFFKESSIDSFIALSLSNLSLNSSL